MAITKTLGQIASVKLGDGGYDDACFGFSFTLTGNSTGVGDFFGFWRTRPKCAEWSEADRINHWGNAMDRVAALMRDAKVRDFKDLAGKPIEMTFDGMILQSWRILVEVL